MGLFTTAITYVGRFIQFLTFSCLICGTYISAAKGWFSAKLTMNATHLITQACHLTVLAMNTWRVSVTWIRTFFCMCVETYFLWYGRWIFTNNSSNFSEAFILSRLNVFLNSTLQEWLECRIYFFIQAFRLIIVYHTLHCRTSVLFSFSTIHLPPVGRHWKTVFAYNI